MKVILYMAMSVNGITAKEDGNEDFLSNVGWQELVRLSRQTGCLIWGRKTYEAVKKWDPKYLQELEKVTKVILTHNSNLQLDPGFTLATSPQQALELLKDKSFTEVILTGGSTNNSSFAKLNLIDEVILNIEPVIVGKGFPLISPLDFETKLEFLKVVNLNSKTPQLHYKVIK